MNMKLFCPTLKDTRAEFVKVQCCCNFSTKGIKLRSLRLLFFCLEDTTSNIHSKPVSFVRTLTNVTRKAVDIHTKSNLFQQLLTSKQKYFVNWQAIYF
jgi:hypothetical protein